MLEIETISCDRRPTTTACGRNGNDASELQRDGVLAADLNIYTVHPHCLPRTAIVSPPPGR